MRGDADSHQNLAGEAVVCPLAGEETEAQKVNEIIMLSWLVIPCAFDSATKMGRFL